MKHSVMIVQGQKDSWKVLDKCSDGGQAYVYYCKSTTTEKRAVVKFYKSKLMSYCENEELVLRRLDHPRIPKLLDVVMFKTHRGLVIDHVDGVDLVDYLNKTPPEEKKVIPIFLQLIDILDECHKQGVLHKDVKLDNVMINPSNDKITLIDFGYAVPYKKGELVNVYHGSIHYSAPEVFVRKPYDGIKAEIWSLGVLLYAMMFRELPFVDDDRNEVVDQIKSLIYDPLQKLKEYELRKFPSSSLFVLRSMLNRHPKFRPSLQTIRSVLENESW